MNEIGPPRFAARSANEAARFLLELALLAALADSASLISPPSARNPRQSRSMGCESSRFGQSIRSVGPRLGGLADRVEALGGNIEPQRLPSQNAVYSKHPRPER